MVKAMGLGLDVFMVETDDYHKARMLAVHVAAAGAMSGLIGVSLVNAHGLSYWAMLGAVGPLLIAMMMAERTRRQEPSGTWSPAHRVTLFRAVLIGAVATSAWSHPHVIDTRMVMAVAALAFALDGVDGWLARRTNSASAYGARLDMELDAVFVLVLSVLVWTWDKAGSWVMLCGAARYLWWIADHSIPWFNRPLFPSSHRRHGCFVAVSALVLCLWPWTESAWPAGLASVATLTLSLSFGIDAVWLLQNRGRPR